jgi:NAD(P)H-hydrate epimerase
MRRLLGKDTLGNDHVSVARDFAVANKLILLLKGSRSLVASPDGRVFITPTGNPGLGTAGSGDTLTGLIAGFLGQAYATLKRVADPLTATLAAAYMGRRTMVASDIRERFGAAIRLLDPHGEKPGAS